MKNKSSALPNIRPASDLRTKYTQVIDEIYQSPQPVFLTKKGRCDVVIMSAVAFSKYELTEDALRKEYFAKLKSGDIRCGFCGKKQEDAERLIAGRNAYIYICNECVSICAEILDNPDAYIED